MQKLLLLITALVVFACVIINSSCDKKVGKLVPPVVIGACDTITYTNHIMPLIAISCGSDSLRSCHTNGDGAGGVALDTYDLVKACADNGTLKSTIFDGLPSPMPKAGEKQLTPEQKSLITCWLGNGTKR